MPVLGHAFVGAATALCVPPTRATARDCSSNRRPPRSGEALWIPIVVVLAYVPDIGAQLALLAGWPDARVATHSLLAAAVAAPLLAWGVTALVPITYWRALGVTLFSIVVHNLLDLAQGTDRQPFWPVSVAYAHSYALIPQEPRAEALLFGLGFVVFLLVRWVLTRERWSTAGRRSAVSTAPRDQWLTWTAVGVVMAAAALTHALRDLREHQLSDARLLVDLHQYRAAIDLADRAERWPSTARPGRTDHVRGEAYAGLGDRQQAELAFRLSMVADPSYFWAVADLADLYASLDEPAEERRRLIAAPLTQLRTTFATHPALPQVLRRLDRKLAPLGLPKPSLADPR